MGLSLSNVDARFVFYENIGHEWKFVRCFEVRGASALSGRFHRRFSGAFPNRERGQGAWLRADDEPNRHRAGGPCR